MHIIFSLALAALFFLNKSKDFSMYFTSLTVTFALLILTSLAFIFWKRNYKLPPGPWGLPVLGYYPFLSDKHHMDFFKLSQRYGNVFSFRSVGDKLYVVLNGVKVIKDILVNRSEEFTGRPEEANLLTWISNGMGISQEEGAVWKEHRRFFLQSTKNNGFGKQESEEMIHGEIKTLIRDLQKDDGKLSDMRFHVAYTVSSIVSTILFSMKFEKYGNFVRIAKDAKDLIEPFLDHRFLVGPIYQHVIMKFFPSTSKIRKSREVFRIITEEIVQNHVDTFNPNDLRDYIDEYLYQAYKLDKTGEKHTFTMERLKSITLNMLVEGTESAGSTVCRLLEEASKHLEEQKLVQEELDSVVGRERLPSWRDKQNLIYLEVFILELFRHSMTFNVSTLYCNYKNTTIEGYRIPRRSIIVANLWSINFDSTLYPEPSKFDPKRFIDENGKRLKTEGPYPFGIGKRSCVGESLAQMEVFLIIAGILQNFTLYPTSQQGYLKVIPRK